MEYLTLQAQLSTFAVGFGEPHFRSRHTAPQNPPSLRGKIEIRAAKIAAHHTTISRLRSEIFCNNQIGARNYTALRAIPE